MTTTQPDLFAGLARADDPETSVEAARKITGRTEARILAVFEKWDAFGCDWTADELCRELADDYPPTVKSAIKRLVDHNLIHVTGEKRDSDRGCAMQVYKLGASA